MFLLWEIWPAQRFRKRLSSGYGISWETHKIMSLLSRIAALFKGKESPKPAAGRQPSTTSISSRSLPPVYFQAISLIPKVPLGENVEANHFYVVAHNSELYWALFRCPDGCGEVISLPLRAPHTPRWSVHSTTAGRPTLKPSVWRNQGCKSHFIVDDGRVFWCNDTGKAPSVAKPELYRRR